jgi:hypothetical protein
VIYHLSSIKPTRFAYSRPLTLQHRLTHQQLKLNQPLAAHLTMAPTTRWICYGQGFYSLHSDYTLPDPRLTPLGEKQCATLRSTPLSPDKEKYISLEVASPLNKALHTAWLVF